MCSCCVGYIVAVLVILLLCWLYCCCGVSCRCCVGHGHGGSGGWLPPSHITSERGDGGLVGGKQKSPLRLTFRAREGTCSCCAGYNVAVVGVSCRQVGAPHCAEWFDSRNGHTVLNDSGSMNS